MDKKSVLALLLIFMVLVLWEPYRNWLYPPSENPLTEEVVSQPVTGNRDSETRDSINRSQEPALTVTDPSSDITETNSLTEEQSDNMGNLIPAGLEEKRISINSPLYTGVITTKGATIESWIIKDHQTADDNNVDIVRDNKKGNFNISFYSIEGYDVDLRNFDFFPEGIEIIGNEKTLDINSSRKITFASDLGNGRYVRKIMTFDPNSFNIIVDIEFENMHSLIAGNSYALSLGSGIRTSEVNTEEDMNYSKAMTLFGSDIETFDVGTNTEMEMGRREDGAVHWIANRSKYFVSLIAPMGVDGKGYRFSGQNLPEEAAIGRKTYVTDLYMGFNGTKFATDKFLLYMGPVDFFTFNNISEIVGEDLELTGALDLPYVVGPLSLLIYRIFSFLHDYVPNYGFVIILFSLILNLIMFPLTAKSYKSMKKMQDFQPILAEMKEKYKDNPQKMQQEQMAFYKEKKINPLGGCLPMLFQMPIFFAIYPVFRTIELRGAEFIWWVKDLSLPDTVMILPFSLPFYGDHLNILTIIYAVSMFVQQKVMITDPKQKMMIYLMPVMMLLMLNSLSSGFILYFIIFNLLSVLQRLLVNNDNGTPAVAGPSVPATKEVQQPRPKTKSKKKK